MKSLILITLFLSSLAWAQETPEAPTTPGPSEEEVKLTPEETQFLKETRENNGVPKIEDKKGIDRTNKKSRIKREDSRILKEHIDVGDVYELKTCFGSPFRISFGKSIMDTISESKLGNTAKFSQDIDPNTRRSIVIAQKEAEATGSVHTTLWLERNSDKRAYIFNITGEPCPANGLLQYPVEIILEKKELFESHDQQVMIASDFLVTLTENYKRRNDANFISINGINTGANASLTAISVSVILKDVTTQKKIREPRFIITDWSKTRVIKSTQQFLPHPTQAETDKNKLPTLRFNIKAELGKRQIMERKFVYLIIMYDDDKYYQIAKIPMLDLLNKVKNAGWEI